MPQPKLCQPIKELNDIVQSLNERIQHHRRDEAAYSPAALADEMHLCGKLKRAGEIIHDLKHQDMDELVEEAIHSSGVFFTKGKTPDTLKAWNRYSYYSLVSDLALKSAFVYQHSTLNQLEPDYIVRALLKSFRHFTNMLRMLTGENKSKKLIREIGDDFVEIGIIIEGSLEPLSIVKELLAKSYYDDLRDVKELGDLTFSRIDRANRHELAVDALIKETKDVVDFVTFISSTNSGVELSAKFIEQYNDILGMRADAIRAQGFSRLQKNEFKSADALFKKAVLLYGKIIDSTLNAAVRKSALENKVLCEDYFSTHFGDPEELLGSRKSRYVESGKKRTAESPEADLIISP